MVVDRKAVPPELIPAQTRSPTPAAADETLVFPAALLYSTTDHFFLELESGTRLSIKADSVQAIVWNPNSVGKAASASGATGQVSTKH